MVLPSIFGDIDLYKCTEFSDTGTKTIRQNGRQAKAASFCFFIMASRGKLWQAKAASFGIATAGQGYKLRGCHCRPRL